MGQGYSVIHPSAGSAGIDVPELADLEYEKTLTGARFLKTVRARHKDGLVVVKVYTKSSATTKLKEYSDRLLAERRLLADVPNALAYHRILETSTSGYIARQYIHSSLYDRISTNPPLEDIEKKWIAFQLLCAVRDCHARDVYHGDIKTENMLVTTWNWLYLTDFAGSFKPVYLPEDNPAEYSTFYDTTARRICYIAPERFVAHDYVPKPEDKKLAWPVDVFSIGCVIAELFTEKPTFTLSQLFRYKKGEYDPVQTSFQSIKDTNIRDMVSHMIALDPGERYTAEEYLNFWTDKVFPGYFYTFLHQYMHLITDPTSGRNPVILGRTNNGEADDRIERIYLDFDKISYSLGLGSGNDGTSTSIQQSRTLALGLFPLQVDIPNDRHYASNRVIASSENSALLILNIVISSLRSTARGRSKVRACELLLALGEQLTDEAKLDRVLPYAIALLEDEVATVRIAALRTITQLLALVNVLSPMNAFVFPRYILPRLQKFVASHHFKDSSPVRATYASCLASLAETASRFLDMTQALRADGSLPSTDPEAEDDVAAFAAYQTQYDVTREDLVQQIEAQTKIFLTDGDSAVRRAFLGSVSSLCVFFGDSLARDLILTHLNTYLNDDDWTLKCAFFETIVGVAAFIGSSSLEDFILPLMIQALTDPEETVTEQVIRSLSSMARLGLFQRWIVLKLVHIISRFTLHPNLWIREAAAQFISLAVTHLSEADSRSLVEPLVKPVLKISSPDLTELSLLDVLKKPFPRPALDLSKTWAAKTDKGVFWKPAQQNKSFSFDASSNKSLTDFYRGVADHSIPRAHGNEEDERWLARLRNAGMRTEDEPKLLALRDYVWRNSIRLEKEGSTLATSPFNHIVSLTAEKVPLQNVLLYDDLRYFDQVSATTRSGPDNGGANKTTLVEALHNATSASDAQQVDEADDTRVVTSRPPVSLPDEKSPEATSSHGQSAALGIVAQNVAADLYGSTDRRLRPLAGNQVDSSQQLSASPASQISMGSRGHGHTLRHKSSAMNLLKRAEAGNKASAEIATDNVMAAGRLDVPSTTDSKRGTPRPGSLQSSKRPSLQGAHSYTGGDPHVIKYLDTVSTAQFPMDLAEFGPLTQPLERTRPAQNGPQAGAGPWKPQGHLVAVIGEHQGQVTCIAVAPNQSFFVTGSDDGSVRIWDTSRLERNVTHRSRQVHRHLQGVRVTDLCFIESTYSFVSAGSDGSINVVKVDFGESQGNTRFGKLQVLRDWTLPTKDEETEYAIGIEHFRSEGQSMCMILTNLSRVLALDLRTMEVVYELDEPVNHGTPTCFCISKHRHWLVIGTSHGVLSLWDLRFRLRLRSWTFRNPAPIYHATMHPSRKTKERYKVCLSGGTSPSHVTVWDLEKTPVCTDLYHAADSPSAEKLNARDLEMLSLDDEKAEAMLTRVVGSTGQNSALSASATSAKGALRSFIMSMQIAEDGKEGRHSFLVTGGPEGRLRFWDSERPASSMVINSSAPADSQPSVTASLLGADTRVYTELPPRSPSEQGDREDKESPTSGRGSRVEGKARSSTAASKKAPGIGKPSRYEVISASAQHLLRGHKDEITCVALLERPFGMVVSADRSGLIYVFQ